MVPADCTDADDSQSKADRDGSDIGYKADAVLGGVLSTLLSSLKEILNRNVKKD